MKRTVIINYRNLLVGGIENIIVSIIKNSITQKHRIVWLCDINPQISSVNAELLSTPNIERVPCDTHGVHWFKEPSMNLDGEENVIISFNLFDQVRALQIKKHYSQNDITALYIVPHFTGGLVFPEQLFEGNNQVRNMAKKLYEEWINAGLVLYCGKRHITALEESYGLKIPMKFQKMLPALENRPLFNDDLVRKRYHNGKFRIVSASRLEFPHKGFIVGLLNTVIRMKSDYPQIELYIIGEGEGDKVLTRILDNTEDLVKADIHVLPNMAKDELVSFYQTCNLSVSVAGCLSLGAKTGLLSLPARHYTYDCEVYGFTPSSKDMTLESKPGKDVEEYIKQAIDMSEEEYLEACKKTYNSYETTPIDREAYFHIMDVNKEYNISRNAVMRVKSIFYAHKVRFLLHK